MAKTPGLNLPYGIDPVNPVPVDSNYGPYANTAAAIAAIPLALRYDGMTVMITGDGEYWWEAADLTDSGIKKKGGGGGGLPIVRDVYLVADASDALLMGGVASNTYTTFQTAYDAANTLQLTLGGSAVVVIRVGNTIATYSGAGAYSTSVGDVTLTADWNSNVWISGISANVSIIGGINGNNASGSAYNIIY